MAYVKKLPSISSWEWIQSKTPERYLIIQGFPLTKIYEKMPTKDLTLTEITFKSDNRIHCKFRAELLQYLTQVGDKTVKNYQGKCQENIPILHSLD
jgi:hypothetical protein